MENQNFNLEENNETEPDTYANEFKRAVNYTISDVRINFQKNT